MTKEDIYSTLILENMLTPLVSLHPSPLKPKSTPPARRIRGRVRLNPRSSTRPRPSQSLPQTGKGEPTIPERYTIHFDREYVEAVLRGYDEKGYVVIKGDRLKYHPFLVSRVQPDKENDRGLGGVAMAVVGEGTSLGGGAKAGGEVEVIGEGEGEGLGGGGKGGERGKGGEVMVGNEEEVVAGEDEATLRLVAELSHESPRRNLRVRGEVLDDDAGQGLRRGSRKRVRVGGEMGTPKRRSMRGVKGNEDRNRNGDVDGDGDEEVDGAGDGEVDEGRKMKKDDEERVAGRNGDARYGESFGWNDVEEGVLEYDRLESIEPMDEPGVTKDAKSNGSDLPLKVNGNGSKTGLEDVDHGEENRGDSGDELALSGKGGWEENALGHVSMIPGKNGNRGKVHSRKGIDAQGEEDEEGEEDAEGEDVVEGDEDAEGEEDEEWGEEDADGEDEDADGELDEDYTG